MTVEISIRTSTGIPLKSLPSPIYVKWLSVCIKAERREKQHKVNKTLKSLPSPIYVKWLSVCIKAERKEKQHKVNKTYVHDLAIDLNIFYIWTQILQLILSYLQYHINIVPSIL